MTYAPAAKTDNPLTGKHYGSVLEMAPAVRKTAVMGVTCLSTGQVGGGSVEYVTMARVFDFQFFAWDAVVKMTGLLMLQKYQSQQLLTSCFLTRKHD